MRKCDEITSERSCLNRAKSDEWLFVLLGRDIAAPSAIRFWVMERIRLGLDQLGDAKLVEALELAGQMEAEQRQALGGDLQPVR